MFEKVAEILADYKGIEVADIRPESTFEELEIDSLDTVELVMSFEDAFGVTIEMNQQMTCVQDLLNLIEASK